MRSLSTLIFLLTIATSIYSADNADVDVKKKPATGPDIVSIDIERVYVGASLFSQRRAQLEKEVVEARESLRTENEAITQLENTRRMTGNGDAQLPTLLKRIELAKFTLQLSQKELQARFNAKNINVVRVNTNDIRKHLATYCQEKNIKMVIRTISGPLRGRNPDEIQLELTNINAYYVAPTHDITDDFVGWLNTRFPAAQPENGNTDIEVVE